MMSTMRSSSSKTPAPATSTGTQLPSACESRTSNGSMAPGDWTAVASMVLASSTSSGCTTSMADRPISSEGRRPSISCTPGAIQVTVPSRSSEPMTSRLASSRRS